VTAISTEQPPIIDRHAKTASWLCMDNAAWHTAVDDLVAAYDGGALARKDRAERENISVRLTSRIAFMSGNSKGARTRW